jgi:tetratricopeptide (TPR) repeat protein
MRVANPQATERFERGEELARQGRLEEGLELVSQASSELPNSSLVFRRICQIATAMGRGPEAISHCYRAIQNVRTNLAVRATVRALIGGADLPTAQQLAQALSLAMQEHDRAPNHFAIASAVCDIADRIGDGVMLQRCATELLRLSPDSLETRRALARIQLRCPPARFWSGWIVIAAALLGTALHAARARLRFKHVRPGAAQVASVAMVGLCLTFTRAAASADTQAAASANTPATGANAPPPSRADAPRGALSTFHVNDDRPESEIPTVEQRNKDPLNFGYWLQDVIAKGAAASKNGDHAKAVQYYRALAVAVPDRAPAFARACEEYAILEDHERAIRSCRTALELEGVTIKDYARYVTLVISQPGNLSRDDLESVKSALEHLKSDPRAHPIVEKLQCAVAERIGNSDELESCARALVSAAPNDPETIEAQFALALLKGQFSEANRFIDVAKKAGANEAILKGMRGRVSASIRGRILGVSLLLLAIGLCAGGIAAWHIAKRDRQASKGTAAPPGAEPGTEAPPGAEPGTAAPPGAEPDTAAPPGAEPGAIVLDPGGPAEPHAKSV